MPGTASHTPKEVILIRITCLAWLAAKLISWKLWLSERLFPVIPPFDFIPGFSNQIHLSLFVLSLAGISAIFIFPGKRLLFFAFLVVEVASCLLDQMRWQPWEYQYLLTFTFFLLFANKPGNFLKLMVFLFGVTYLFSGLHKCGGSFLHIFWDRMVLEKLCHFPASAVKNGAVHYSGLLLAFAEVAIGIGLLLLKNKKPVVWAAIMMHAFILLALGPLGLNYNVIIWPWNLAMICCVAVLSGRGDIRLDRYFFTDGKNLGFLVLLGFLPLLNFFGYWDHYLSFNLYSGDVSRLAICIDHLEDYPALEKYRGKTRFCESMKSISPDKMALDELKVPLYPQERTYRKLKKEWDNSNPGMADVFVVYGYPYRKENAKALR